MTEYITVTEKIERRTYLKGRFTGKFIGFLDASKSDLKIENFFDLEITEAEISIFKSDFRTWKEGGEFEEFSGVETFLTKLPVPVKCEVIENDGSVRHYNLHIFEPKLADYKLFNRLYEKDKLFATIEGNISGYLKHFETIEKQIEKIQPLPEISPHSPPPDISYQPLPVSYPKNPIPRWSGASSQRAVKNAGCAPALGCSAIPAGGCLSIMGAVFIAYLCLAIIAMVVSAAANLFGGWTGTVLLSFLFSVFIPVFLIGSLLYIFVRLQNSLAPAWKWVFRLLIAFLIFVFWLN